MTDPLSTCEGEISSALDPYRSVKSFDLPFRGSGFQIEFLFPILEPYCRIRAFNTLDKEYPGTQLLQKGREESKVGKRERSSFVRVQ